MSLCYTIGDHSLVFELLGIFIIVKGNMINNEGNWTLHLSSVTKLLVLTVGT